MDELVIERCYVNADLIQYVAKKFRTGGCFEVDCVGYHSCLSVRRLRCKISTTTFRPVDRMENRRSMLAFSL